MSRGKLKGNCDTGNVCPLKKEKSVRCSRPPRWRFVTGRCKVPSEGSLCLSVHALTTVDDMVLAQREQKLNGRQACHPKAISSTYNFISQFQGLKQRSESFIFYRTLYISLKSTDLTSLKISNVCTGSAESCITNMSLQIHPAIY